MRPGRCCGCQARRWHQQQQQQQRQQQLLLLPFGCCGHFCMAPAGLSWGAYAGLILPVRKKVMRPYSLPLHGKKINESSTGQPPGCLGSAVAGGQAGQPQSARPSAVPLSHEIPKFPPSRLPKGPRRFRYFCRDTILRPIDQLCFVSDGIRTGNVQLRWPAVAMSARFFLSIWFLVGTNKLLKLHSL